MEFYFDFPLSGGFLGLFFVGLRKPRKVKNRFKIPIHAPIYITFGKKVRNSVGNTTIQFEVQIINIKRVIQNLRFGHRTLKISKFSALGRTVGQVTILIFPQKFSQNILATLRKFGTPIST